MKTEVNKNLEDFIWLQNWYYSYCDGDWEHGNGVHINTLDNPGWSVSISLYETELEKKEFEKIHIDRSEDDWLHCYIKDLYFEGVGGPFNLPEILRTFREWAEN